MKLRYRPSSGSHIELEYEDEEEEGPELEEN